MEVYSIIADLHEVEYDQHSLTSLLRKAFHRNKYLLAKYATNFQHNSPRQFRDQVRLALKEVKPKRSIGYTQRLSSRQMQDSSQKNKQSLGLLLPLNLKASSLNSSCKHIDRPSVFRNLENLYKTRTQTDKSVGRQTKQALGYKLKKIWLGEELQKQCDQKIQSFLSNRYKSTLARLRNLYSSAKTIPTMSLGPSYFINHSLAGYISKNLTKR